MYLSGQLVVIKVIVFLCAVLLQTPHCFNVERITFHAGPRACGADRDVINGRLGPRHVHASADGERHTGGGENAASVT